MKSVSLQSFSAFLLVSIEKLRGPFWHVDIQVCMSFDRIVHNFAPGIFVWLRPDREADTYPGPHATSNTDSPVETLAASIK
jgi:hypothetical protein